MIRIILFSLFLVTVLSGLIIIFGVDSNPSNRNTGWLSITSYPVGQTVLVNGEVVGVTPLVRHPQGAGEHKLKIGDRWEEVVRVNENTESIVWRTLTTSGKKSPGFSIQHESSTTLLGGKSQLVITTDPASAKIRLDDEDKGETPIEVKSGLKSGKHTLSVSKNGYQTEVIDFNTYDNTRTLVKIDMNLNLIENLQKISLERELSPPPSDRKIVLRTEWGGDYSSIKDRNIKLVPWKKIEIWSVSMESTSVNSSLISDIDLNLRESYGYAGIPFAYLIDRKGVIYEGLGIYDYDFSGFSGLNYSEGMAPVLVLDDSTNLNNEVQTSLSFLQKKLSLSPVLKATPVNNIGEINLSYGERREVKLLWQNISSTVWQKDSNYSVWLGMDSGDSFAMLYDPETWQSKNVIKHPNEDHVFPSEPANFTFWVKAPYLPVNGEGHIYLVRKEDGSKIENSSLSIKVKVQGETNQVLEIKDTPTGSLNVRSGPSLNTLLLTTVYPKDQFLWFKEENGWIEIAMQDGKRGWVNADYTKKINP